MSFSDRLKRRVLWPCCMVLLAVAPAADAADAGRLTAIQGEVELNGKPAVEAAHVQVGSVIRTGKGKCTLLLGKESVIHIDADSELKVTETLAASPATGAERSTLDLSFGRTRALIRNTGGKKDFKIRSRSVVMGVRGTQIFVDSPKDPALPQTFATLEGLAEVRVGAQVNPIPVAANEVVKWGGANELPKQGPVGRESKASQGGPQDGSSKAGQNPQGGEARPQVDRLSPDEAKKIVNELGPVARELNSIGDLRPKEQGDRGARRPLPPRSIFNRPPLPVLDPIRDAPPVPVKITVKGIRQ